MFSVRAYGLAIDAELPLPELPTRSGGAPDVVVELGPAIPPANVETMAHDADPASPELRPEASDEERRRSFDGFGTVVLAATDELVVYPDPTAEQAAIRQLVLGPGLRLLFHHRGHFVLHGSAVAVDGVAVAFLGPSGAGKSTTAAAFAAAGHDVVADDVLVVPDPGDPELEPGVPSVKLDDDTAAALGLADATAVAGDDGDAATVVDDTDATTGADATDATATADDRDPTATADDRDAPDDAADVPRPDRAYRSTREPDASGALPLERCYLLADGDAVAVEPVDAGAAVYELMYHSVGEYDADEATPAAVQPHFDDAAALARTAGVARVSRPRQLSALEDLIEAVEEDCSCSTWN